MRPSVHVQDLGDSSKNLNIPGWEDWYLSDSSRAESVHSTTPRKSNILKGIKEIHEYENDAKAKKDDKLTDILSSNWTSPAHITLSAQNSEAKPFQFESPRRKKTKKFYVKPKLKPMKVDVMVAKFIRMSFEQENWIIKFLGNPLV